MYLAVMKRYKSTESLLTRYSKCQTSKLLWSDWVKAPFLNYLDLIDLECKKNAYRSIPWFHIPFSEADILHYSTQTVYSSYKSFIMEKIDKCDLIILSSLIRKLLRIANIFDISSDVNTANILYYTIIHRLFDRGSKDSSLLLCMWNTLCVTGKVKVAVFSGLIGKHRKRKSARLLEYVLKNARSERFDFWGAWTKGHKLDNFHYCPVTAALLSGNVEQMNLLIKYGFEPNSQRMSTYDKHFVFCSNSVYDWLRKPLVENISPRRKIITEVLLFLVGAAISRSQLRRISMSRCFHLMWEVTSTPFVTKKELRNEVQLRFLFPPDSIHLTYFPSTERQFLKLCEFYDAVFLEEDEALLQPRSLKHLCRCTIRGELQKSWNLPTGIGALPLPKHLKQYLDVNL